MVREVYQIHCTEIDQAAICIDSCCHCGESVTVTIHWLHGDTIYICFSPFGGCSVQAQSCQYTVLAQYTAIGDTVLPSLARPCAKRMHALHVWSPTTSPGVCAEEAEARGFIASNQVHLTPAPELCTRRTSKSWAPSRLNLFFQPSSSCRWWAW